MTGESRALAHALAGAHAALWGYGVVAPRVPEAQERPAAADALVACRALRDALTAEFRARGATPVAAEPAYALPFPVDGGASARRLAVHLEDGLAPLLGDLVASAQDPDLRAYAADALAASARRRVAWGAPPSALPGYDRRVR